MAARASADAGAGRYGLAAAELAAVACCVGVLVLVWSRALSRITLLHDASSKSVRAGRGVLTRVGNRGRAGAVAARDLRYQWRDPRRRVLWVQVVVLLIFVLGPAARASGGLMVAGVAFVASVLSMQAAQQFGYDGAAYWMQVSATGTRADVRSDLLGKAIAASAVTVPLLVTATAIGAVLGGRTAFLAEAVVVELSAFGLGLAGSTLLSVWFPVPLPDSARNVFGSVDPGRGCLAGLAGLGMTVATLGVVLAFTIPLLRFVHGPAAVVLCAALLALAVASGIAARAAAARIAFGRLPELLAAVTPRGG
jgi:ABC-2 type transport system permease protein